MCSVQSKKGMVGECLKTHHTPTTKQKKTNKHAALIDRWLSVTYSLSVDNCLSLLVVVHLFQRDPGSGFDGHVLELTADY